ncbi:hypothetical protein TNCV_4637981 [Trichonephila clavipes]|uniref:Uncharacterized protein n=1 Tax=Trichonephila clavipes TaxID=2585209 RepID=A0A8X6WCW9_TRICX|nr:hypothetical protein TNCV_4637981 [Trichonephila clavipes]
MKVSKIDNFNIPQNDRHSVRVVAYCASTPQVRVPLPGWARSTQPFLPIVVGREMSTKLAWGQTLGVSLRTDHLFATSVHAPQRQMVKYTGSAR